MALSKRALVLLLLTSSFGSANELSQKYFPFCELLINRRFSFNNCEACNFILPTVAGFKKVSNIIKGATKIRDEKPEEYEGLFVEANKIVNSSVTPKGPMPKNGIPQEGGALLIANHVAGTGEEAFAIAEIAQKHGRKDEDIVIVMADNFTFKDEKIRNNFYTFDPGSFGAWKKINKDIPALLRQGKVVIMFPSGASARYPNKQARADEPTLNLIDPEFLTGFVHWAEDAQVPIVPIHLRAEFSRFVQRGSLVETKGISRVFTNLVALRQSGNKHWEYQMGERIEFGKSDSINVSLEGLLETFTRQRVSAGESERQAGKSARADVANYFYHQVFNLRNQYSDPRGPLVEAVPGEVPNPFMSKKGK